MELKDYIQYYLHCDFYLVMRQIKTRITNYYPMQDKEYCVGYGLDGDNGVEDIKNIKPMLRKLEDMTDDDIKLFLEWDHLIRIYKNVTYNKYNHCIVIHYDIDMDDEGLMPQSWSIHFSRLSPAQFDHLIKKGFDIFSLIKNGLAVDSKTLK